ncbi:hypothetical protein [Terrimonas ferruginea]|uniref:hypothetical protein n=1 Tax=Terrimonas ferruginea TaxID=249 RepID=UPI000404CEFC|nr:hypothetical protein [Terrimonas ferruginea]
MQSSLVSFRHWLIRIQPALKWPFLLLLTFTLIAGVLRLAPCEENHYPEIMIGLALVSVWLFVFRMGLLAMAVLLADLLIVANHGA